MQLLEIFTPKRIAECNKCNRFKTLAANSNVCSKCKAKLREKKRLDQLAKPAPIRIFQGGAPGLTQQRM